MGCRTCGLPPPSNGAWVGIISPCGRFAEECHLRLRPYLTKLRAAVNLVSRILAARA